MIFFLAMASALYASSPYLHTQTDATHFGSYRDLLCERLLEPDTPPQYPRSSAEIFKALQNEKYLVQSTGESSPSIYALSSESGSQPLRALRLHFRLREQTFFGHKGLRTLIDLRRILEALPTVAAWISVDKREAPSLDRILNKWPGSIRERVQTATTADHVNSTWVQDASKPTIDGQTTMTLAGAWGLRDLALRLPWAKAIASRVEVDGGNIVVGDRHVFVGRTSARGLAWHLHIPEVEVWQMIAEEFGRPVVPIAFWIKDEMYLNAVHIDLDMAVARDWHASGHVEVAVVNSPRLLFETLLGVDLGHLLEFAPTLAPGASEEFRRLRRAYLDGWRERVRAGYRLRRIDVALIAMVRLAELEDILREELSLESYRRTLSFHGYRVVALPGTNLMQDKHNLVDEDNLPERQATLLLWTYANVVLSGRDAMVSHYGVDELDRTAARIYTNLGYNVIPMRSAPATICHRGGFRCLTETYRQPYSSVK